MKTIRANAEKILTENMNHVNAQIDVQASANNGEKAQHGFADRLPGSAAFI